MQSAGRGAADAPIRCSSLPACFSFTSFGWRYFWLRGNIHESVSWRDDRQELLLPARTGAPAVLVVGKFIAGLSATALIFAASTALQLAALLRIR
jgi:hypothetical protein